MTTIIRWSLDFFFDRYRDPTLEKAHAKQLDHDIIVGLQGKTDFDRSEKKWCRVSQSGQFVMCCMHDKENNNTIDANHRYDFGRFGQEPFDK